MLEVGQVIRTVHPQQAALPFNKHCFHVQLSFAQLVKCFGSLLHWLVELWRMQSENIT